MLITCIVYTALFMQRNIIIKSVLWAFLIIQISYVIFTNIIIKRNFYNILQNYKNVTVYFGSMFSLSLLLVFIMLGIVTLQFSQDWSIYKAQKKPIDFFAFSPYK